MTGIGSSGVIITHFLKLAYKRYNRKTGVADDIEQRLKRQVFGFGWECRNLQTRLGDSCRGKSPFFLGD
ncbi:MAG: hypothetical protein CMJ74_02655 [Planctomycetaceae bacterium]|nr:hypothetical protein [Planctomycetaceae bacterium]